MAITSWPFENADTTEGQFSQLFRELQDTGVIGSFGDASLRVTGDSTGMQVKVSPGAGFVRGFVLSSTAIEPLVIAPAGAQPRVDRIVARLDPATDSIRLVPLQGAPAATDPQPPILTQTDTGIWDMPLARVTVRAGSATVAAGDVIDERPWIGHRVGIWTSDTRPAGPRLGRLGLNASSGRWEYWDSGWKDIAPVVQWSNLQGVPSIFPTNWSSISSKPEAFPPASHTHAQDQVAGLPALRTEVTWLNNNWSTKSDTNHTHATSQVFRGGERLDVWQGAVDASFDTTRRDIAWLNANAARAWGGDVNVTRYSPGPTSTAYTRNAGNDRYAVYMDGNLEWGRNVSSRRYKDRITPAEIDVSAVLALTPVTYHRQGDPDDVRDLGLIAEDCTAVDQLVIYDVERDSEGQPVEGAAPRPEAVRYEQTLVVALLAVCQAQQAQIDTLTARLDAWEG